MVVSQICAELQAAHAVASVRSGCRCIPGVLVSVESARAVDAAQEHAAKVWEIKRAAVVAMAPGGRDDSKEAAVVGSAHCTPVARQKAGWYCFTAASER